MRWILILFLVIVIAGCQQAQFSASPSVEAVCQELCNKALEDGLELSNGSCLSDDMEEWDVDDWVCDVAHNPRADVDNIAENQCREFREGNAHHFVEVDPECGFIRSK